MEAGRGDRTCPKYHLLRRRGTDSLTPDQGPSRGHPLRAGPQLLLPPPSPLLQHSALGGGAVRGQASPPTSSS